MARDGWRMTTIAPRTIETAPTMLDAWIRQRTLWINGRLQTGLAVTRDPVGACRGMGIAGLVAAQAQPGAVGSWRRSPMARRPCACR